MSTLPLLDSITAPIKASADNTLPPFSAEELHQRLARLDDEALRAAAETFCNDAKGGALLAHIHRHSPYLSHLIGQHAAFFAALCRDGAQSAAESIRELLRQPVADMTMDALMTHLRIAKSRCALLTAIADLGGVWPLEQVTHFLSETAESCLERAVEFLLLDARNRGELTHISPDDPAKGSGLIVLGMGKLGAWELNYSSDIDIIVLFDGALIRYEGRQTPQQCFSRITRDLVRIMQERTPAGYVFRTDIRLRPDPASTPPAMSFNAAMTYYETVGQNWERAAMIKARPVAGDITTGEEFLKALTPFIWRRNLDFAAIADIHSIKRQIDHRTGGRMQVAGHNLKLGAGGIREIEFFVQVQQLIWGGRNPRLRHRGTCEMLDRLAEAGIITTEAAAELRQSYRFLREMEHRVQMQRDQQSHSLPAQPEALAEFAGFAGYDSLAAFEQDVLHHLRRVKYQYTQLYGVEDSLGNEGNLVFTGVDADPGTVETLQRMGFTEAERICGLIANWHRGHRRATRNKRARELLTEITPDLLKAFASSVNPDAALLKFDEFLGKLPAGVQIFSLFAANPHLLRLIAMLMGSAPRLAEILSRNTYMLDAVLTGAFYAPLPGKSELHEELDGILAARAQFEDFVDIIAQFKNEKAFQAGIQLMNKVAACEQVGHFLSDLAEVILSRVLRHVSDEFAAGYGRIAGSELALVALGKLGARELTFASDLDLIFVYNMPEPDQLSDGERTFTASVYFNRLCQRLTGALTSLNREGRLYEVDTRLRPLGSGGPLAASFEAYDQYFADSAWTFEFMALTRARIIDAPDSLRQPLERAISRHLTRPRDTERIRRDVADMRAKVEQGFGTQNPWNVKYIRGGMMDLDFIAQYLQLIHAAARPGILAASTQEAFRHLQSAGLLDAPIAAELIAAHALMTHLLHLLRLCSDGSLDEESAPEGLKTLLADQLGFADFAELKLTLIRTEDSVYNHYLNIIKN